MTQSRTMACCRPITSTLQGPNWSSFYDLWKRAQSEREDSAAHIRKNGLFDEGEAHDGHGKRKNEPVAKTLDLDRLSSTTPNYVSNHRHREPRNHWADEEAYAVKSRRMDKRVWKDRETNKSGRTARNYKHRCGEKATEAARYHEELSNRSREKGDKDLEQDLNKRFAENLEDRAQQGCKKFVHGFGCRLY